MFGMWNDTNNYAYLNSKLSEIILSDKFNTKNVTKMDRMFANLTSLQELDLSSFDTSNVTTMYTMFQYNISLKILDLSKFDTNNVINMQYMFYNCISLEKIYISNKWNTNQVTDSSYMFNNTTKLPNYNSSIIDKTKAFAGDGGYLTLK